MSAVTDGIQSQKPSSPPPVRPASHSPPRLLSFRLLGAFREQLPRAVEPPGGRLVAERCRLSPSRGDSGIHRQAGSPGTPGLWLTLSPAPPSQVSLA